MKILTEKLDYQLYDLIFIKNDYESARKLWNSVCQNPVFLKEAIVPTKVDNSGILSFRAPMITFMILRFPNLVQAEIYQAVADMVIKRRDIATTIAVAGKHFDFLTLVLKNSDWHLEKYQKDFIMQRVTNSFGVEEEKSIVSYNELIEMESPVVARMVVGDLDVRVTEYEWEMFTNGEVKNVNRVRKYKDSQDYRDSIIANANFQESEKEYVLDKIEQDEQEFRQLMNYLLSQIAVKYGIDLLSVDALVGSTKEELEAQFGEDALAEILLVKQIVMQHYQKESLLVRKIN